jgi:hypothetical protein
MDANRDIVAQSALVWMSRLQVSGVAYRAIASDAPTVTLVVAHRRGETSPIVRNFVARTPRKPTFVLL